MMFNQRRSYDRRAPAKGLGNSYPRGPPPPRFNRRGGIVRGSYGRGAGGQGYVGGGGYHRSWQSRDRVPQASWQRNSRGGYRSSASNINPRRSNNYNRGNKRPWRESSNQTSKKPRVEAQVNTPVRVPLSTVILATAGDKKGSEPKLVFSGFYDCQREAKIGKTGRYLNLSMLRRTTNPSQRTKSSKHRNEDRVSIPIPFKDVDGLAILGGEISVDPLLKAHAQRANLTRSIENLKEKITSTKKALETAQEELAAAPPIPEEEEEKPEKPAAVETEETAAKEDEEAATETADADKEEPEKEETEKPEKEEAEKPEKEAMDTDEAEEGDGTLKPVEDEEIKKEKAEKRKKLVEQHETLKANVDRIMNELAEAQEKLTENMDTLDDVNKNWKTELRLLHNSPDNLPEHWLDALKDGMSEIEPTPEPEEQPEEGMEEVPIEATLAPVADEEMPEKAEAEDKAETKEDEAAAKDEDAAEKTEETAEKDAAEPKDGAKTEGEAEAKEEEAEKDGEKEKDAEKEEEEPKYDLSVAPVRVVISLKKPLEKFFASNPKSTICQREVMKNTTLVILEYTARANKIEEHLKLFAEVCEGPWKEYIKEPNALLESPYKLENTVSYLTRCHKLKETWDNGIVKCKLCGTDLRRMSLKRHETLFCAERAVKCSYCKLDLKWKELHEHHQKDCPNYLVPCPNRCNTGNYERCKIEEHLKVCPKTQIQCRYRCLGCQHECERQRMDTHLRTCAPKHIELLETRLSIVTNFLMEKHPELKNQLEPPPPPLPEKTEKAEDTEMPEKANGKEAVCREVPETSKSATVKA